MKGLFTKLTIIGLVSTALVAPELPELMKDATARVQKEIYEAEQADETENNVLLPTGYLFHDDPNDLPHTPTRAELAKKAKAYLESDKVELAQTVNLMKWLEVEAKKVNSKLKTQKGRYTLKAMGNAFQVQISDVETFLSKCSKKMPKSYPNYEVTTIFHNRLEAAFDAASSILFQHITAGILVGSSDEQADLEILLKSFKRIAPSFGECFDDDMFYCSLRDHYAECCAVIPQWDVSARYKVATQVTEMGRFAFDASDDGDKFQTNHALVVVAENFVRNTQLSFVNKAAPTANALIFKNQNTFQRLLNFLEQSPETFKTYYNKSNAAIDADLTAKHWDRWVYVGGHYVQHNTLFGSQIILINQDGCTSVRLKQSGEFSIGFLAPYSPTKHASFSDYLYDRTTELLKLSSHHDAPLAIPAARPETKLTPFWRYPNIGLVDAVMADAHF